MATKILQPAAGATAAPGQPCHPPAQTPRGRRSALARGRSDRVACRWLRHVARALPCRPAVLVTSALLAGCAAHPGPIVDMKGVDRATYERDLADCESYAAQIRTEVGVAKGAAAGAAVGAATGAIVGNAGKGAGLGAVSGGAESARLNEREKQRVVKRCMRGRGYRVLN